MERYEEYIRSNDTPKTLCAEIDRLRAELEQYRKPVKSFEQFMLESGYCSQPAYFEDWEKFYPAVIGIMEGEDGESVHLLYSYEKVMQILADEFRNYFEANRTELSVYEIYPDGDKTDWNCEAIQWIEYNMERSIPYMGENFPIFINTLDN